MVNYFDMSTKFNVIRREGKYPPMSGFHSHQINELVLVENGESAILTEASVYKAKGAYIIFYPAGVAHQQINSYADGCVRWQINYSDLLLEGLLPAESFLRGLFVLTLDDAQLSSLRSFFSLLNELASEEADHIRSHSLGLITAALVNELSAMVTGQSDGEQRKFVADNRIRQICLYINKHFGENITLEHLTSRFYISRAQLVRRFKQILGITVNEYLTGVRISEARVLLSEGYSLTEIAARCGFSNPCYFIKVFRRELGITPAKYRASFCREPADKLSARDETKI